MNIDKTDYISYPMNLVNKFEVKKKMATMKIQNGALVTSQQRYDSSNRFISRHLISGVSFMSISSIVFKKWGGGHLMPPPMSRDGSLNRVKGSD